MNIGIDLGTTYSLVAKLEPEGIPLLVPDSEDREIVHTPSVVLIGERCAFVGQLAETLHEQDPELKPIRFFKRALGSRRPVHFDRLHNAWYAEGIAALVLRKLLFDAESYAGDTVAGAVITVPAHFNESQRAAVVRAAQLAELPLRDLLEEPVAAALHYGVAHAAHDKIVLVYDLGGGTFDATVISMDARGVYVLAKDGLTELGGREFDAKLADILLGQFKRAGAEPPLTARTLLQLHRSAESLKLELCTPGINEVQRVVVLGDQAVEVHVRRDEFETAITDLVAQTEAVMLRCLTGAGLGLDDVHAVLLVGGSSMVPFVGKRVRAVVGREPERVQFHEPTKAVAFGAALRTAQLTGDAARYHIPPELRGVTGYNVGLRAQDPRNKRVFVDTVIKKNMPLPVEVKKSYYTSRPNQDRIDLELVQFRESPDDAVVLGRLVVGPLPPREESYPVEVTVQNREDGTIGLRAYDSRARVDLHQEFHRDERDELSLLTSQGGLIRGTLINVS